jgi:hypothetical protein
VQCTDGFAKATSWQELVSGIVWRYQNDLEIAGQSAVLKAIVEQMKLRAKLGFGKASGAVAILADDYRNLQTAGDQQRFITELLRRSSGINVQNTASGASVPAG